MTAESTDNRVRRGPLNTLASFATRHPKLMLAAWVPVIAVMAVVGLGGKDVLKHDELLIKGSSSERDFRFEQSKFGRSETIAVLLKGDPVKLKKNGQELVRRIERLPRVSVSNPWADGAPPGMLSGDKQALMLIRVDREMFDVIDRSIPDISKAIDRTVPAGVHPYMTGVTVVGGEIEELLYDGTQKAELFALPILLIVLLLIFRSPIAAAMPLLLGISVIAVVNGIVALLGQAMDMDAFAQTVGSMIGLALGVDYSLLIVSRFREELKRRGSVEEAIVTAIATAGRTVAFAGGIVVLGTVILLVMVPQTQSLVSASISLILAACLSVLAAVTLLPAMLQLAGYNINRWRFGRDTSEFKFTALINRIIRKPVVASLAVLIPLLVLVAPALALKTGTIDSRFLDPGNKVREDTLEIVDSAGPGWASPYTVVVSNHGKPITDAKTLTKIADFQKRLSSDSNVDTVVGPALVAPQARKLDRAAADGSIAGLGPGMAEANRGVAKLRLGVLNGSEGAQDISQGAQQADAGVDQLAAGVDQANQGLDSLASALNRTAAGSQKLAAGVADVKGGAARLSSAAAKARTGADEVAGSAYAFKDELKQSQAQVEQLKEPPTQAVTALESAKAALDGAGLPTKADPHYQDAYGQVATALGVLTGYNPLQPAQQIQSGYYGMSSSIDKAVESSGQASDQAGDLYQSSQELASSLGGLATGNGRLATNTESTLASTRKLQSRLEGVRSSARSLGQPDAGAVRDGLASTGAGAAAVRSGLDSQYRQSAGVKRQMARLEQSTSVPGDDSQAELADESEGDSGARSSYLTLAALSGASADERRDLELVLNTGSGSDTARMFVMTQSGSKGLVASEQFSDKLNRMAADLQEETGKDVRIGGRTPIFDQFSQVTSAARLPTILAVSLVSLLFLITVFRSILLAVKAVILNLLTVGAAFGVTQLLFGGSDPLLGGPGWMEAITFFCVYVVVFTLSMDYEIFIINRMREAYLRTGDNEVAIAEGISNTAGIITGAATVMIVLFSAIATFGLAAMKQFGIAMVVAVLIDATLIRLVLLPATMRLFGRANWWMPKWLDRFLPTVDLHGPAEPAAKSGVKA